MEELVSLVSSRLKDQGVEPPEEEIRSRLKMLIENFKVPEAEARRSVMNYFLKESGKTPIRAGSEKVKVSDIKGSGKWVEIEVKVLQLWQPTSEAIAQTGLVGDETGRIKFTRWARDSTLPMVEEGRSYLIKNAVTDEFQGRPSIKMTRTSRIEPLDRDVQADAAPAAAIMGPAVEARISEIKEAGKLVDLKVRVVQLWEPTSDSIAQTGLIGDETGTIKFVHWARDSALPMLDEGRSYHLKGLATDEFQGRFSVKMNRGSEILPLDEDVPAPEAGQRRPTEEIKIADINAPGQWADLRVKVVQLWEPTSEAIAQTGLIGDPTGSIKFVRWARDDLPEMEDGKAYLLKSIVTDEYQGRFSVKMNRLSQIEPIDEDIAVGTQAVEFTGALVEVQKGSGLIKRCPVCNRSLNKNMCAEHGKVDGTYDLRIKAVLDDGRRVQDVLINREMTEKLAGMTLDEAKQIALEALDHEVVRGLIAEKIIGRYYTVTGPRIDRYILVQTVSEAPPISTADVDSLLSQVEVD